MNQNLDTILAEHDMSIGLSNDKTDTGNDWEFYDKRTEHYQSGYATANDAYSAAGTYLYDTYRVEIPKLNEDGELVILDKSKKPSM